MPLPLLGARTSYSYCTRPVDSLIQLGKQATMASGLLMLLDDIASILDDVAALTKVAIKKTSGVLGDDLALNAQQVSVPLLATVVLIQRETWSIANRAPLRIVPNGSFASHLSICFVGSSFEKSSMGSLQANA